VRGFVVLNGISSGMRRRIAAGRSGIRVFPQVGLLVADVRVRPAICPSVAVPEPWYHEDVPGEPDRTFSAGHSVRERRSDVSLDDLPDQDGPARPWSDLPVRGWHLLLSSVLLAAVFILVARFVDIGPPTPGEVVLYLLVQSALVLGTVWLAAILPSGTRWRQLGLRWPGRGWVRRGFLVGLASVPVVWLVNVLVQVLAGGEFRNPQLDLVAPAEPDPGILLAQLAVMAVLVPALEETVFRGLLFGWLRRRWGMAVAAGLSALVFGVAHGIPLLVPAISLQGVILAVIYERSGSLVPCIVVHGTLNAVNLAVMHAALAAGAAGA
jgi:membrane protease YdiL (CAAX protease family)